MIPSNNRGLAQLRITPGRAYRQAGAKPINLRVQATFADGSTEDVTGLCSFDSLDRQVATVDSDGQVLARGVGDAALIVRYRG